MPLMTKKAYADKRGCTKEYLSKADVKERLSPAMEIDPADGKQKINSEKADEILKKTSDLSRTHEKEHLPATIDSNSTPPPTASTFHATKTERERLKLTTEQLDLEERLGNTLEKRTVVEAVTAAGQKLREHLQARNRRLAEKLATITDPLTIRTLMDEDDRAMLTGISDDLARGLSIDNATTLPAH